MDLVWEVFLRILVVGGIFLPFLCFQYCIGGLFSNISNCGSNFVGVSDIVFCVLFFQFLV